MDLSKYTYKSLAFTAAINIMLVIIAVLFAASIVLNLWYYLRNMQLKRRLKLRSIRKNEDREEELQQFHTIVKNSHDNVKNRDGTEDSGYNTWSDDSTEIKATRLDVQDSVVKDSILNVVFKFVIFVFEIGTVLSIFSILDVYVTFGYIQPTNTFLFLKLLILLIKY